MFRSWWQLIKQYPYAIGFVVVLVLILFILSADRFNWDWTGFNGYNQVTITQIISGSNAGTVTRTEEYQLGKGLWDWLQLLGILAIPAVVGLGAAWYTAQQSKVSDRENTDNQRETALQAYIDKMSELLLHEKLRDSTKEDDEVRNVARVRTLTVLARLDNRRIKIVLEFLYRSHLIMKDRLIISLSGANIRQADLRWIFLENARLNGAFGKRADLRWARLKRADLGEPTSAKLTSAKPILPMQTSLMLI